MLVPDRVGIKPKFTSHSNSALGGDDKRLQWSRLRRPRVDVTDIDPSILAVHWNIELSSAWVHAPPAQRDWTSSATSITTAASGPRRPRLTRATTVARHLLAEASTLGVQRPAHRGRPSTNNFPSTINLDRLRRSRRHLHLWARLPDPKREPRGFLPPMSAFSSTGPATTTERRGSDASPRPGVLHPCSSPRTSSCIQPEPVPTRRKITCPPTARSIGEKLGQVWRKELFRLAGSPGSAAILRHDFAHRVPLRHRREKDAERPKPRPRRPVVAPPRTQDPSRPGSSATSGP